MNRSASKPPMIVITRPQEAAARLLRQITAARGTDVTAIMSPVLEIEPVGEWSVPPTNMPLIITSPNAVRGDLTGHSVYCVGARTASAVLQAGGDVSFVAKTAEELTRHIIESRPRPLRFLRGVHVASNIAQHLSASGVPCGEQVVYAQHALPLTSEAKQALEGERPVILPLFSPRSARLVGGSIALLGSRLTVISMSAGVDEAWRAVTGGSTVMAATPTSDAMVSRIVATLAEDVA